MGVCMYIYGAIFSRKIFQFGRGAIWVALVFEFDIWEMLFKGIVLFGQIFG